MSISVLDIEETPTMEMDVKGGKECCLPGVSIGNRNLRLEVSLKNFRNMLQLMFR